MIVTQTYAGESSGSGPVYPYSRRRFTAALDIGEEDLPLGSQDHRFDCEIQSLSLPQSRVTL